MPNKEMTKALDDFFTDRQMDETEAARVQFDKIENYLGPILTDQEYLTAEGLINELRSIGENHRYKQGFSDGIHFMLYLKEIAK